MPALPAEVWTHILRLATHVPYFLLTNTMDLPYYQHDRTFVVTRYLQDSLAGKLNLVLVCKLWYTYGIRFLYEGIVVRRYPDIGTLKRILQDTGEESGHGDAPTSVGHFVKRFDIASVGERPWNFVLEEAWKSISDILRCLPRLQMWGPTGPISSLPGGFIPPFVIDTLMQTCGSSLQILSWTGYAEKPRWQDLARLLRSTPNLHFLQCAFGAGPGSRLVNHGAPGPSPLPNVHLPPILPQVTSVSITSLYFPTHTGRPSLIEMIASSPLEYIQTTQLSVDRMSYIFSTCSSRLMYLNLAYNGTAWDLPWLMEALRDHCPNLRHLQIMFTSMSLFTSNLQIPPSVEVLVVEFGHIRHGQAIWDKFSEGVQTMTANGLKEFVLVHQVPLGWPPEGSFKAIREHLKSMGVVFRDSNGDPFCG
ncbi:hypothetical protein BDN72DRAFT_843454 [Pluteus cervinus]|uniref:Uncharacterized protein n=1 Tax=Pluteus cervinus TaxID=181527 RepID=A0ACD3AMJ4_9AGAR|nr:hypothetical protein BDN72DRAFT_843454 [Pluteus cervinus]